MTDLDKIDLIRQRLDVSYREAKDALEASRGDIVEALVRLENVIPEWNEEYEGGIDSLLGRVWYWIDRGNRARVRLRKGNDTLLDIPGGVGALGIIGVLTSSRLAMVAGMGTVAALLNDYRFEVDRAKDSRTPIGEI